MESLKEKAKNARLKVLDMIYKAQTSHIGSNFSVIDILTVLFEKADLTKDKIILSAGWKAAAFYYFLAEKGYFPKEKLDTYCQEGSELIGLTEPGVPGVLFAGGSMQMGLPAAVGFALSKKLKGEEGIVYCVMSDGELAGGMVWESLLIARHHELNNLVILIDNNKFQAMGYTDQVLSVYPYKLPVPGYLELFTDNFEEMEKFFDKLINRQLNNAYPYFINCRTKKGKGVLFMENNNLYHYKNLSEEEYLKAKEELQNG